MNAFEIAWRSVRNRPVLSGVTVLILAVGLATSVALVLLGDGLQRGVIRAAEPFDLLIGAKGSANQLVLSTSYLQDAPLGNLPHTVLDVLRADPRVRSALPLALGDLVAGYPMVGTEPGWFDLRTRPGVPPFFRLASGRPFERDFEAVVGAGVDDLAIGAEFLSQHGQVGAERWHERFSYRVVGRLEPTATPLDRAVFVSIASYWDVHRADAEEEHQAEATAGPESEPELGDGELTAILVTPVGFTELYQLHQEINRGTLAQAVLPGQVIGRLLDLLDQGERLLALATWLTVGLAACTAFLALYASAEGRRRQVAILRGLGAPRSTVLASLLWESSIVVLAGTLLGLLLGHLVAALAAGLLVESTALAVTPRPSWREALTVALVIVPSLAAALAPTLGAYHHHRPLAPDLAPR